MHACMHLELPAPVLWGRTLLLLFSCMGSSIGTWPFNQPPEQGTEVEVRGRRASFCIAEHSWLHTP